MVTMLVAAGKVFKNISIIIPRIKKTSFPIFNHFLIFFFFFLLCHSTVRRLPWR